MFEAEEKVNFWRKWDLVSFLSYNFLLNEFDWVQGIFISMNVNILRPGFPILKTIFVCWVIIIFMILFFLIKLKYLLKIRLWGEDMSHIVRFILMNFSFILSIPHISLLPLDFIERLEDRIPILVSYLGLELKDFSRYKSTFFSLSEKVFMRLVTSIRDKNYAYSVFVLSRVVVLKFCYCSEDTCHCLKKLTEVFLIHCDAN